MAIDERAHRRAELEQQGREGKVPHDRCSCDFCQRHVTPRLWDRLEALEQIAAGLPKRPATLDKDPEDDYDDEDDDLASWYDEASGD